MRLDDTLQFIDAVKRVTLAASKDDCRPALNCLFLECISGKVTLTASDGHRLHHADISHLVSGHCPDCAVIIPRHAWEKIVKAKIKKRDNGISWFVTPESPDNDGFEFGGTLGIIKFEPIPGEYPNYRMILQDCPTHEKETTVIRAIISRLGLEKACKRAGVFAKHGSNALTLHLTNAGMLVHGKSEETGEVWSEVSAALDCASDMTIAANWKYLADTCKASTGEEINLYAQSPTRLILIESDGMAIILMPMKKLSAEPVKTPADIFGADLIPPAPRAETYPVAGHKPYIPRPAWEVPTVIAGQSVAHPIERAPDAVDTILTALADVGADRWGIPKATLILEAVQ